MAHLTCIARVDQDEGHGRCLTLIGQEQAELAEDPRVGPSAFCPIPGLLIGALSDPGQVLTRDSLLRCDRLPDDPFADDVVGVTLEPPFTPRYPFPHGARPTTRAAGALRGFLLNGPADPRVVVTRRRHLFAAERRTLARHGDVCPSQVHTKDTLRVVGRQVGVVRRHQKPPAPLAVAHQVRFGEFHRLGHLTPLMPTDAQLNIESAISVVMRARLCLTR